MTRTALFALLGAFLVAPAFAGSADNDVYSVINAAAEADSGDAPAEDGDRDADTDQDVNPLVNATQI